MGHTSTGKILWHPSSRKYVESRNVRFLEKLVYKNVYKKNQTQSKDAVTFETNEGTEIMKGINPSIVGISTQAPQNTAAEPRKRGSPRKVITGKNQSETIKKPINDHVKLSEEPVIRRKSKAIEDYSFVRFTRVFNIDNRDELGFVLLASLQKDPKTFEEAMNSKDNCFWDSAFKEELKFMKENNV